MRGSRHWVHCGVRCFSAALLALCGLCSGCAVIAVADAVVTTGVVVVKTGVKATGAVIGAVIPD